MTTKIKITYIVSAIDKAIAFEWIVEQIDRAKFELSFILINSEGGYLHDYLKKVGIETYSINNKGKVTYLTSIWKTYRLLKQIKPSIVHCHLRDANIIGLIAAMLTNIKTRIYTRHHATFHHQYFPKAVIVDRFVNYLATDIVAISKNVERVLIKKEKVKREKIHLIHHGFDLEKFSNPNTKTIEQLTQKYNLQKSTPVVGVIARYINWKGYQYLIPAFKEVLDEYPEALLLIANASGPDKKQIQHLLRENIPTANYLEIPFEQDLFSLYHLFDVYVHVPINDSIEAFGQTYIEALAAGIPSVFTLSGVASEFIVHEKNALVVPFKDEKAISEAISRLFKEALLIDALKKHMLASVTPFALKTFIKKLEKLYA